MNSEVANGYLVRKVEVTEKHDLDSLFYELKNVNFNIDKYNARKSEIEALLTQARGHGWVDPDSPKVPEIAKKEPVKSKKLSEKSV